DDRAPQGARSLPRPQAPRDPGRRRPRGRRRGRSAAARRRAVDARARAADQAARGRAPALRRRPQPRRGRHRDGHVGGGRSAQRVRGTAQVGGGDDVMSETRLAPPTFDPADAAAAAARFATSAPADVHYALVDTPVGTLVAATTQRGLVTLSYTDIFG